MGICRSMVCDFMSIESRFCLALEPHKFCIMGYGYSMDAAAYAPKGAKFRNVIDRCL